MTRAGRELPVVTVLAAALWLGATSDAWALGIALGAGRRGD